MWLDVFNANPYGTNCWLLAGRGHRRGRGGGPRVRARGRARAARRRRQDARGGPATHAHVDHAGAAGDVRRTTCPCTSTRPTPWRSRIEPRLERRLRESLAPVKDLRTIADGDVLRFAGFALEVAAHARPHARPLLLPHATRLVFSGDLVFAGIDRALRLPQLRRRGDAREPRAVPARCPTSCRCFPGHGPTRRWAASARSNPFLRGARADGARAAARDAGPAAAGRRRDARAVRGRRTGSAASSATATWRRRPSSTPSSSRAPAAARRDVVTKEMYTFEDKGGRSLTLRPEGTARRDARLPRPRAGAAAPVQGLLRRDVLPPRPPAGRAACASSASSASR